MLVDASPSSSAPSVGGAQRFVHSDLMRAVRAAGGPRVLLVTDGCNTTAKPPVDPGFPVHVVLVPRRDAPILLALDAPARTAVDASFGVRVTVGRTDGPGAEARTVRVRLRRDGERIGADQAVRLARGQRRAVAFVDSVGAAGVVRYEATIVGKEDLLTEFVRVGDRPHVAVVGSIPDWEGFSFARADARTPCDAYLISAPVADPKLRSAIAARVRGGAGLLALGAPDAPLLPLTENPPQGRAVVVLLDISGSMEPHLAALRQGFFELCGRLEPNDRIALIHFRGGVVDASAWRTASEAAALWTTPVARGGTELEPALKEAAALLLKAEARHRRLYVVSDGAWGEVSEASFVPDIHRAALFVTDTPPDDAVRLFPIHARGARVLTTALRRLEDGAPDRWVKKSVSARRGDVADWLRGALPAQKTFVGFPRLYARGEGERIALAAGDVPIVATREEGGRIVQVAAPEAASASLLRACLADTGRGILRAWRDGRALELEASGSAGAEFRIGDRTVPARARGPDRWGARLDPAPVGGIRVLCAGMVAAVPALADAENAGLSADERYASALARVSGGRLYRKVSDARASRAERAAAIYATLLAAALLGLASAWLRGRR